MHFLKLDKLLPIESDKDLYNFWLASLAFRKSHRHIEKELANYIFLKSNETRKILKFDPTIDDIIFEFAALETPGQSGSDAVDPADYADRLWNRLESIVNKEFIYRFS
jgi:hypothetical protein